MNRWTLIALLTLAFAVGFSAAWWLLDAPAGLEPSSVGTAEREVLYWVAPMDANYRRDGPGKSPMGMDLVPVYADQDAGDAAQASVRIDPTVINNIGVRTEPVRRGTLNRMIDTVGIITPDDARVAHIHVRAEGWIEELRTVTVGARVNGGDLLFRIYSPALVSAQEEYLQTLRAGAASMIGAAETRLVALGMRREQVDVLRDTREVRRLFDVRSPQDGFVMQLNVRQGMFVQPGNTIMSLADLATVWVDVDVFESRIGWVEPGQTARMRLPFAPDRVWTGEVDYIYPTIRAASRTARVRLKFDNPDLLLKPEMYAKVEIDADPRVNALLVPTQAVIRHPEGARVILALGDGHFRPVEVIPGVENRGTIEIIDGLSRGEQVVVSAQFLIDSEASLDASLLRMIAPGDAHQRDMQGHDMEGHDMQGHDMEGHDMEGHDMEGHDMESHDMESHDMDDHSGHDHEH